MNSKSSYERRTEVRRPSGPGVGSIVDVGRLDGRVTDTAAFAGRVVVAAGSGLGATDGVILVGIGDGVAIRPPT